MQRNLPESGAYGDQMAEYFHLDDARTLLVKPMSRVQLAITRLHSNSALSDVTSSIPPEEAFLISIHLHPAEHQGYETWIRGRPYRIQCWRAGAIGIYDLESSPAWRIKSAFDCVHYHLPRATLDAFSEENGLARVDTLYCAQGTFDPVLHRLTQAILPFLVEPHTCTELFLEHFRLMLCAHVLVKYGDIVLQMARASGGLAPWQKRRMLELLNGHSEAELSLPLLAKECGLSVSHFARSFKRTFGDSVHRYLVQRRIEAAKTLLSRPTIPLTDVALQSGFSDQAAFSRTFKAFVGTTPGSWRREQTTRNSFLDKSPSGYFPAFGSRCAS